MVHRSEQASVRAGDTANQLTLRLERNVGAPSVARAAMTQRCQELDVEASLCQSLILLVSEVVSNAVRHSRGPADAPIELMASFGEKTIRVTVVDAGHGFTPRPRDPGRTHDGYGLYLLEKVAARWGVDARGGTKVWFELARVP